MENTGDQYIHLNPGESKYDYIKDSNFFLPVGSDCYRKSKITKWKAITYKKGIEYKSCDFEIKNYVPPFPDEGYLIWRTIINAGNCDLVTSALCGTSNCLNKSVNTDSYDINISIKDDNNWEPPKIISPDRGHYAEKNYITVVGQGLMEDKSLPLIITSFDNNIYQVDITGGTEDQWSAKVWVNCGISGTVSIKDITNSGVTIIGTPCGATITSMKENQILSSGKYNLSGLINGYKLDDIKNELSMKIASFSDPEHKKGVGVVKEYKPNIDIKTGKWSVEGLDAECFTYYTTSIYFRSDQEDNPDIPGQRSVNYDVSHCPVKITKPTMYQIISSTSEDYNKIGVEGKVTQNTPLNISASYSSGGKNLIHLNSRTGNDWLAEISDTPNGFIKIKASNTGTDQVKIKNSEDEVIILKSKEFSVNYELADKVFIDFYGTSMPMISEKENNKSNGFKESLHPTIRILLDGENSDEIIPDERGNWKSNNKYYAKRGLYTFTKLKIEQRNNDIYRRNLIFDVSYSKDAKVVCIFNEKSFSCKNNSDGKGEFYLGNISAGRDDLYSPKKALFNISGMQKIEGADPFDPKLWSNIHYDSIGGYFPPDFNRVYDISLPKSILSVEIENNVITGFGGDNKSYTDMNNDIMLPSEYSICMKKGDDSPLPPDSSLCSEKGSNDVYLKIPFEDGRGFSELPIKYGDFSGRKNFPIWGVTLPRELKKGFYYLEVTDKYHPLGLPNVKETWYSVLNKSYFLISTPEVTRKTPSVGDINTEGKPSFISGDANLPGDEVAVKKRKITPSLASQGKNNLNSVQETVICTGAIVNDNGQWECSRPVIFTAGTYELTAELMKAGKIVAKNTTYMTVKKKNNKEKDKEKFESDYPKNNVTVNPDGTIQLFGSFGTAGGVIAGAGVAVVGLFGSIFGAVSGAVSFVAGLPATLWGVAINPNKLGGGDIYTLTLQETHYGQLVGDPITWTFTMPMRITEPGLNAQYRIDSPISIKGEGSPGQLILIASSQYLLPSRLTVGQVPENNLICQITVKGGGTWVCPNNPAMTAKLAGTFFLYGAQYKKTAPGNVDATYERTSAVARRYDVTQTRINITAPRQGTKITVLPLTITGTGEPGAQVHLGSFGGTPKCNTDVEASGIWSCGPYQPEKGKYTLSAEQLINNQPHSTAQVSFDVQTDRIRPLVITQPHHGGVYRYQEPVVPAGQGEPGTTICLAEQALEQVCQNGVTVDKEGRWTGRDRLNTARKGEQILVATAFLGQARQSTAKVTFQVKGADGERLLTVNVPGEEAVIKTPSYTFSGTLPANGRSVTVHAFGGNEGCAAELNLTSGMWTCGPYSAVPGDYRAVIEDDTGSRIARSFKVRYGDNLQMRVLEPAEGAQIDRPLYTINGTGQTGARITVTLAGEPVCETTVDEHQTWACPERQLSRQGDYQLLAQQWVDEVPSGKVVMRDYRVTYRIQDLSVLQPAEEVQITTPTYDIRGKGTSGAQVTVAASGKPLCSAIVDGQQNWVCPRLVSSLGWYEIEARQTLEGDSWGKPVTRHYEVIYGMPDIVINSTAPALCPPPNTGQPTSAFVTGKALPGSYITLNTSAGHTCGTTQVSAKGGWSCRLDNVWLGKFRLTASLSFTPDGHPVVPAIEQKVTVMENTFRVREPGNRMVYQIHSFWGSVAHVTMYGVGTPGAEVELEVVGASGWKGTGRVRVGDDGGWEYDGFKLGVGEYTLHASQQGCNKGSSADIYFSVVMSVKIPCPPHAICDN
ncbi:hypothetical protein M5U04_19375 [Xenorhabdus sp. XENO-1]|uniref:hypothetical protein n=1 Tax=Xenorhabdus bovienii TaxID=40576 RepID=UPI0020CA362D|nr:hypothetical protein [Xenorhabdus bovienii]MCP9270178.1 hypothetical protein [Xenorhabdus bovienii subsp. africana]